MQTDATGHDWLSDIVNQRKQAKRKRLAYMFLDVFLGAFIVGIVLMAALGRPIGIQPAVGGGGESFILVEFYWENGDQHSLTPVIKHNGTNIHSIGLATTWDNSEAIWPSYSRATGFLDQSSVNTRPFEHLMVEGFSLDSLSEPMTAYGGTHSKKQYGYIWISKPCKGNWEFSVRPLGPDISEVNAEPVKLWVRWRYQDQTGTIQNFATGGISPPDNELFREMKIGSAYGFIVVYATDHDDDGFTGCTT